ncbi:MAG TPA: hypothetical protein VFW07_07855 [Parafilimonas sp.]|nr:hypothetical protein [Parafilimonas sp.]
MKKLIFSTLITTTLIFAKAQSVITIQHGSTTLFATTLDSAIIKAQNGDYIYLPGGLIATSSTTITINKNLKIFGAGYHPDSSSATGITQIPSNILSFASGSDNSMITGIQLKEIYFSNASTLTNITITRCNFQGLVQAASNLTNILVTENVIKGRINGAGVGGNSNILFQKNIIYDDLLNCWNYSFTNNIFLKQDISGSFISVCVNDIFENNVFINPGASFNGGSNANNTFNNNLFVIDSATLYYTNASGINNNNLFNQNPANIFVNLIQNSQWTSSQNFHLQPGSAGKGKGKDGTDIGIYGSAVPFKEGGIPLNPHIRNATIAATTNANGKLSINITVTAQNQ